jgi:arsenate reductase (thioredoxin)
MNSEIQDQIRLLANTYIKAERKVELDAVALVLKQKIGNNNSLRLNFICTHNSRRSHLGQIWAQTLAFHFGIKNVQCYSGGTEATAVYKLVLSALTSQGFEIVQLSESQNPNFVIKFDNNEPGVLCFSKKYDHPVNPRSEFVALLTCDSAYEACPSVQGASHKLSLMYQDPKMYDVDPNALAFYKEKSIEIASELYYIFNKLQ